MLLLRARFAQASTGCARVSRCLSNVLLPRYHLRYYLSWSYTQISRTSPQRHVLWHLWGWGGCAAQVSLHCLGGFLACLHAHAAAAFFYLGTLSARDVGSRSTPYGFAYCKSSRERRVGSPAGQYLGCACVIKCLIEDNTVIISIAYMY